MQNIAGKRRERQKDVESDYLFANFLQLSALHSTDVADSNRKIQNRIPHRVLLAYHGECAVGLGPCFLTCKRRP